MRKLLGLAGTFALLAGVSPAWAGSHLWRFNEFYSSPDRTIQFIEMQEIGGSDNERLIAGHWYETNSYNGTHSETLGTDLPFGTADKKFLVGSASYAALPGVPAPDYIVPDGIIDPAGDTVVWWFYQTIDIPPGVMPSDGTLSITVVDLAPTYSVDVNSPTNFAGETGSVVLPPGVPALSPGSLLVLALAAAALGTGALWRWGRTRSRPRLHA
jgi:hypothetical protein